MEKRNPEQRAIELGKLKIDTAYQRMIDPKWVSWIVRNYDPMQVQRPKVSARKDGSFYVIDGQHTVEALKLKFLDESKPIYCDVFYDLTPEQEAKKFYEFNSNKKKVSFAAMVKAKNIYGDKEAETFTKAVELADFKVGEVNRTRTPCVITAVSAAFQSFKELGGMKFCQMLRTIKNTWEGESWSVSSNMIKGMTLLYKTFEIAPKRFADRLCDADHSDIKKEAAQFYAVSSPKRYAMAIATIYNKRGHKKLDISQLNFTK